MDDKEILIENIDRIHTTKLGIERIKNNLNLNDTDEVLFIKNKILDKDSIVYKQGKNYYIEIDEYKITVNSNSYTIITAHLNRRNIK